MSDRVEDDRIIAGLHARAPDRLALGKLRKRLVRLVCEALHIYAMIRPNARWLVCLSGGKDSYTLRAAPIDPRRRSALDPFRRRARPRPRISRRLIGPTSMGNNPA